MTQAQTFTAFAHSKAQSGNFADTADVRKHFNEHQYKSWLDTALNEYRAYLTDNFPTMTLAQAQQLQKAAE